MRRFGTLKNLIGTTGTGTFSPTPLFSRKLIINKLRENENNKLEVRYFKNYCSKDAETGKRHRMCAAFALSGIKRHARTPGSDVFPYSRSAGQ